MRALGVDFGSRRIGVAVSSGSVASPYDMVERSGDIALDHRRLLAIAVEAEVDVIVVGMPYSLDGSMGPAAQAIESELVELRCSTSIPIETYDERLTTVTATRLLQEAGVKGKDRRQLIDKVAAAVLLQAWIDGRPSTSTDSGL
ncbi:COG0816 Predicted endonuclease involved in recombination (possible Holliday junction resolvase in Mycoplasmas and B. subtilis) [Acidimicrobiia bacterium]